MARSPNLILTQVATRVKGNLLGYCIAGTESMNLRRCVFAPLAGGSVTVW